MTETSSLTANQMQRVLYLVVGVLLLRLGFRLWSVLAPSSWVGVVVLIYIYATALGLLVAAVANIDYQRWGRWIAVWCVVVISAAALAVVLLRPGTDFGTDALLFSRYSVDLTLQGRSPYGASMAPASEAYNTSVLHITPKIDGGVVESLSYPAGSFVAFLPEAAIGGLPNLMPTLLVCSVAALCYLVLESPAEIAIVPVIVFIGSRNLIWNSIGGIIDVLWLLPLLLAMREWHAGRRGRSALAYGLAAGTKQQVWPIAPFLAVWLWAEADDWRAFLRSARTTIGWGAVGFFGLNAPFIIAGPRDWALSVLTPIAGGVPLVHQGVGPTMLTVAGLYPLPKSYFSLLVVLVTAVSLVLYAVWWDRARWVAWIMPPIIFYVNYRSLNSYFVWYTPVAYYALLCAMDLRVRNWWPSAGPEVTHEAA